MITPCSVNIRLYVSACKSSASGNASCTRMIVAAAPPSAKKNVIAPRYSSAIRLWSVVSSHERSVVPSSR